MLVALALALLSTAAPPTRPAPKPVAGLEVTVTDPAGKPVEGALVMALATERLYRPDGEVDSSRVRSALTGRDGRARIDAPPPAPWTVVAHARGFVTAVRKRVAVGPVTVRLEKGQTITGIVRDGESGRPVAGARVSVPATVGAPPGGWEEEALRRAVVTDAQGRFRLEGIGPGRLRVTARATGYAAADRPNVRPGEAVELFLFPGAGLMGFVRDEAGRPVKDAEVRLEPNGYAPPVPPEKTDASGGFAFAGATAGEYTVVAKEGARAPALAVVTIDPGASPSVTLTLTAGSYVVGRVVDGAGRALSARVRLDAFDGRRVPVAVSDRVAAATRPDGGFALGPVPPGTLGLRVSAVGHVDGSAEAAVPASGRTVDVGDVTLDDGLAIRGHVRDAARNPIAGATVGATVQGGEDGPPEAETDAKGAFVVAGLKAGRYDLRADAPGFAWGGVVADAGGAPVTITLAAAGTVTGRVVDADGAAVDDARVEVERPGSSVESRRFATTRSDEGDGAFTLRDLAPGAYALVARASGRGEVSMSGVRVQAGATTALGTITLPAGGVVRGSVVDSEGRGIPGATVSVDRESARRRRPSETQTDSAGAFEVRGVPAGVMRVVADHPSYAEQPPVTTEVDPAKEPSPLRIVLLRGGTIEGRVIRRDGRPFTEGRVGLFMPQRRFSDQPPAAIGADGSYRIEHAPSGRGEVSVLAFTPGNPVLFGGAEDVLSSIASREVEVREDETARADVSLRDVVVAGKLTRGGRPAAGVAIAFTSISGGTVMTGFGARPLTTDTGPPPMNAVSREDGSYELVVFTPGTYMAETMLAGQSYPVREAEVPDAERFEFDVELGSATVSGIVVDREDGAPVPGARVSLVGTGSSASVGAAEGGADGRFSLGIEPGDYRLRVRADDRQPVEMPLGVSAAGVSDLRVEMERGLAIAGRVLDAGGRPLPGLPVVAMDGASSFGERSMAVGDGSFRIAGLRDTPYRLLCGSSALGYAVRDGVRPGGEPVTLRLRPGGRILVRVVDAAGQPLPSAYTFLDRVDGFAVRALSEGGKMTDATGMATLPSPEGLATVRAREGTEEVSATGTVAVRAGETATLTIALKTASPPRP